MGQGAGTAAALALQQDCPMRKVEMTILQKVLRSDGVYLEDVPEPETSL